MRVGIDVGGTKLLAVLLDATDALVTVDRRPTPATAAELLDDLGELATAWGPAGSVGVGVPGLVTRDGVVRASPHLPELRDWPLRDLLVERLGRLGHSPVVTVDNDATAATFAEWRLGAGRGVHDLLMVTLGTGIGGGFVLDGRLYRGARGFAGEIGHATIVPGGTPCPCGRRGCWERYAAGTALAAAAGFARGEDAIEALHRGDARAVTAFEEFTAWVGLGLSNLVNTIDPARVVVGGGLSALGDELLDPVRRHLREALYAAERRELPDLLAAGMGEAAGAIGAALLAGESTGSL